MTLTKTTSESASPKLEKYVQKLRNPAKRAKSTVQDVLEKSIKRLKDEYNKLEPNGKNSPLLKKIKRISDDLDVLKVLTEDEIIIYALSTPHRIMAIASNPRISREVKIKARVASHKPLFMHLTHLKEQLSKHQESESESEDEKNKKSSTLDKMALNNTIILMRKDVKRAKVHIIHKWTKNIKKLREAKGSEDKVAKFQKKADRFVKKIIHVKEVHEDDISKFALSTTQDLKKLASDIKAPVTSQVMATIATHPFVTAYVIDFKNKYPDWQKLVPKLLKKKKNKRKLNLETNHNVGNSDEVSQSMATSDDEDSKSENERESEHSGTEGVIADEDESEFKKKNKQKLNLETNHNFENSDKVSQSVLDSNDEDSKSENDRESEYSGSESVIADEHETEFTSYCHKKSQENPSDSTDEMSSFSEGDRKNIKSTISTKSKTFKKSQKDLQTEISSIIKVNNKKIKKDLKEPTPDLSPVKIKPREDKPKVVDPFFVTTTNEEYVTSQAPISSEDNMSSGKFKREHFYSKNPRKFDKFDDKNEWSNAASESRNGKFGRIHESVPYKKQNSMAFTTTDKLVFGNRKERRKAFQQSQVEEKVEHLHPSWEAKRKQSTIIPFQGKKVTFD